MARAGEEDLELHYTAEFRTHPPPQAASTVYFAMDVDDVPAVRPALGCQAAGAGSAANRGAERRRRHVPGPRRSYAADGGPTVGAALVC